MIAQQRMTRTRILAISIVMVTLLIATVLIGIFVPQFRVVSIACLFFAIGGVCILGFRHYRTYEQLWGFALMGCLLLEFGLLLRFLVITFS